MAHSNNSLTEQG